MKSDRRFVFDTNVIISALLFEDSIPAQAFYQALANDSILLSQPTLAELDIVSGRKKFERYVSRAARDRFLDALIREATLIEITEEVRASRDPKDDKFLELAISGQVSCIISGDEDLLELTPWQNIPILTPTEFLKTFSK
jgi:putative PIN family toxin of toxin-antitoxin system